MRPLTQIEYFIIDVIMFYNFSLSRFFLNLLVQKLISLAIIIITGTKSFLT